MTPAALGDLAARFDAFLVDQFGVLLDGNGAYPWAPAALGRLAATGKPVLLLSNSGKRSGPNEARLTALGFARGSYLGVLSSGEAAFAALARRIGDDIAPGTPVWVHARDGDTSASAGLDLVPVDDPAGAQLILLAGCTPLELSLDAYAALLRPAARRRVEMVCTNPDLEMLTPQGKRFGAGRVARLYEQLGGPVTWIGKPYAAIYREALRRLPGIAPGRILCIGDSPAHDIAGGHAAGMATALVRTGLHADLDDDALRALCDDAGVQPDFLLPAFRFDEG